MGVKKHGTVISVRPPFFEGPVECKGAVVCPIRVKIVCVRLMRIDISLPPWPVVEVTNGRIKRTTLRSRGSLGCNPK